MTIIKEQLTDEQIVTLQLRIMSALSFYQQRTEKEAKRMAELLMLAGAAASELQGRRKAAVEAIAIITEITSHNGGIPFGKVDFTRKLNDGELLSKLYAAPPAPVVNAEPVPSGDEDSDYFTTARLMEIVYGAEPKWPEQKLLARFMLDMKQRAEPRLAPSASGVPDEQ